jgi:GNAT superfamily N-acetyltransferase
LTNSFEWRGAFEGAEVGLLHADSFGSVGDTAPETDWQSMVLGHSLGWVTARDEDRRLVGFVNVIWDGASHAWLQDVMVSSSARHHGVGTRLVAIARGACTRAGCAWLHVDFAENLVPFYVGACGFQPTAAGLIRLDQLDEVDQLDEIDQLDQVAGFDRFESP